MLGCGGGKGRCGKRCGGSEKVLGEVRESVLGCGEVVGRCEKVCWDVGEVGGDVRKCWEDVKKCFGVEGSVGVWGRCEEVLRRCGEVCWDVMWGSVGERCGKVCWDVGEVRRDVGGVEKSWGEV